MLQVAQRPSIGSILADPLVQKRREALECNAVSTRTNSSDNEKHDLDNIEKLRNNLIAKMRQLELKEKELESKYCFDPFCQNVSAGIDVTFSFKITTFHRSWS